MKTDVVFDILIKDANIYDGNGSKPFKGAVAVQNGKICAIGDIGGSARTVIDGSGLAVSPGFIDPHTHYDAQFCWDKTVTPSSWHGVTTVMAGNCSVGVAPCKRDDLEARRALCWQLTNIESISMELLENAVSWRWDSFEDYMREIMREGLAVNPVFLVPMGAVRLYVMGPEAQTRGATDAEARLMAQMLRNAMEAGASGFSVDQFPGHVGHEGSPNACLMINETELKAYANVVKDLGYGIIQYMPTPTVYGWKEPGGMKAAILLGKESGQPIIMLGMAWTPSAPDNWLELYVEQVEEARREGVTILPQVSFRPITHWLDFQQPVIWAELPCFVERVINRPWIEQKIAYSDPEFRARFRKEVNKKGLTFSGEFWHVMRIETAAKDENKKYIGMMVPDLAKLVRKDPLDALFDLAVDDGGICFTASIVHSDIGQINRSMDTPGVHFGQGDGGAHIGQFCTSSWATYLIDEFVRKCAKYTMEEAIFLVTGRQADTLGLSNKGRLVTGKDADLVVFSEDEIRTDPSKFVHDLPGGEGRFIEEARGIHWVIVNGVVTFKDGVHQGTLPGKIVSPTPELVPA